MPRKTRLEVVAVNWSGLRQARASSDPGHDPTQVNGAAQPIDEHAGTVATALESARIAQLAEEEERRADEVWRQLQEEQRRRTREAERQRLKEEQEHRKIVEVERPAAPRQCETAPAEFPPTIRDEDAPDSTGWTPREQRLLEVAMRANPATMEKRARWGAIAAAVGRSPKECVARARALAAAVKAALPPPLLRLQTDAMARVCEFRGGRELCALAATNKELTLTAHDDLLWLPLGDALPNGYAYSNRDRGCEPVWRYTLRLRQGLYGSWHMLTEHRAGTHPYLNELGRFEKGHFRPLDGALPYRIKYGAICELVQREAQEQGGLNHRVYKAVADLLVACSANSRSRVPPDLHMTVREIFKTCYPGFGSATGSGAYAPGVQSGGSSAKGHATGSMVGKGVSVMTKKVQDEEMRKRLETCHEFLALVP